MSDTANTAMEVTIETILATDVEQQQQQQQQRVASRPNTPPPSPLSSSNTNTDDDDSYNSTSLLVTQKAAAQAKLKQALLAKKRALEKARLSAAQALQPIHALLKGNDWNVHVGSTGLDEDKVRFVQVDTPEPSEACLQPEGDWIVEVPNADSTLQESMMLIQRRIEIHRKLAEAKQRKSVLEEQRDLAIQQAVDDEKPLNREELLKRRNEVERKKAVTQLVNFIVKQENLKRDQEVQLQETTQALTQMQVELEEKGAQLGTTEQELRDLKAQQQVLKDLVSEYVQKLLNARERLHQYQQAKARALAS